MLMISAYRPIPTPNKLTVSKLELLSAAESDQLGQARARNLLTGLTQPLAAG